MKKIHEISKAIANLEEKSSGEMVSGFTVLAPEHLSIFLGGVDQQTNKRVCNANCDGANCVSGCGSSTVSATGFF